MVDYRKEWIKNRILTFLDEKDESLFDQMCARHGNKIGRHLTEYLEDRIASTHDIDKKLFVVYKTYYDKVVHEEVLVAEQVERAPPPPEPEPEPEERPPSPSDKKKKGKKGKGGSGKGKKRKSSRDSQSPTEEDKKLTSGENEEEKQLEETTSGEPVSDREDTGKEDVPEKTVTIVDERSDVDEKKEKKKSKKQQKKGRRSPPTVMETLPTTEEEAPPPEPEFIYVKKIIEKVVKTPQIHGYIGSMTKYDVNKRHRFVYFIRRTDDGIPCPDMMSEAFSEMPGHFQVGCTSANMLNTMIQLIPNIFIPLVSHQFMEPHLEEGGEDNFQETDKKRPPVQTVFNTPSDYRQMALDIRRELEREEGPPRDERDDDDPGVDLDMLLRQREHLSRDSMTLGIDVLVHSTLPPLVQTSSQLTLSTASVEHEVIKRGLLQDLQKLLDTCYW